MIGQNFPRLRMGIGNEFPRGMQVDWVLGRYSEEELQALQPSIDTAVEIIRSFVLAGVDITMNQFNKLGKGVRREGVRSEGEKSVEKGETENG